MRVRHSSFLALATALALSAAPLADAATITIVNLDGAGEGFNDPTAAAPVGGNPGVTIGAQRLFVFQHAASLWGAILPSSIEIRVNAQFNAQFCDSFSAVLGSAGPVQLFRDFSGAPIAGHWYHVALGNKLSGTDLSASNDINATFNSSLGPANCLGVGWYYGVDGNEGSQVELLPVVLHELGHGLGFSTSTSGLTGNYNSGFPTVWDHYLMDNSNNLHWDEMTPDQRIASANACTRLVWDGDITTAHAPAALNDKPVCRINAPGTIDGNYEVGAAQFGPPLSSTPVTANVVQALDASGSTTDGCEALINAGAVAGNIAIIDRGTCPFTQKVKNAQNAGAIGVIIVDNAAGCPPPGLGGTDGTITIPSVRVTLTDGTLFKANLGAGLNATLILDPTLQAGADGANRVLMYTPLTFSSGSSVSHFDVLAEPNLLMEPAINGSLSSAVDLTKWLFADIGWFQELLDAPQASPLANRLHGNAPNPFGQSTAIRFALEREQPVDLAVYDLNGRLVTSLHRGPMGVGSHSVEWNGRDQDGRPAAPGIYLYRIRMGKETESRPMVLMR